MEEKLEEALTYELYESFEEERAEWLLLSAQFIARAYSDSEPEYSVDDVISSASNNCQKTESEMSTLPTLPLGWFYPDVEDAQLLLEELECELPQGHLLSGRAVEPFAWRKGVTDDVLFRHKDNPERYTIVHLTYLGRTEVDAAFPTVEFDGTFAEFLRYEQVWGQTPLKDIE